MTVRATASLRADRRGIAAVEFALIAPVFLTILFGIFVVGLYLVAQIAVTIAATEGARAAVGALTTDNPNAIAVGTACTVLNNYAPFLTCAGGTIAPAVNGTSMVVSVSYPLPTDGLFPFVPFVPASASWTATVQYKSF